MSDDDEGSRGRKESEGGDSDAAAVAAAAREALAKSGAEGYDSDGAGDDATSEAGTGSVEPEERGGSRNRLSRAPSDSDADSDAEGKRGSASRRGRERDSRPSIDVGMDSAVGPSDAALDIDDDAPQARAQEKSSAPAAGAPRGTPGNGGAVGLTLYQSDSKDSDKGGGGGGGRRHASGCCSKVGGACCGATARCLGTSSVAGGVRRVVRWMTVAAGIILIGTIHNTSGKRSLEEAYQSVMVSTLAQVNDGIGRILATGSAASITSNLAFTGGRLTLDDDVHERFFMNTLSNYDGVTALRDQFAGDDYKTFTSAYVAAVWDKRLTGARRLDSASQDSQLAGGDDSVWLLMDLEADGQYTERESTESGTVGDALDPSEKTAALYSSITVDAVVNNAEAAPGWLAPALKTRETAVWNGAAVGSVAHVTPIAPNGFDDPDEEVDGVAADGLWGLSVVTQDISVLRVMFHDELQALPIDSVRMTLYDKGGRVVASAYNGEAEGDESDPADTIAAYLSEEGLDVPPVDEWLLFDDEHFVMTGINVGNTANQVDLGMRLVMSAPITSIYRDRSLAWTLSIAVIVVFAAVFCCSALIVDIFALVKLTCRRCCCFCFAAEANAAAEEEASAKLLRTHVLKGHNAERTMKPKRLVQAVSDGRSLRGSSMVQPRSDVVDGVHHEALWSLAAAFVASVLVYVIWTAGADESADEALKALTGQIGAASVATLDGALIPPVLVTLVSARAMMLGVLLPGAADGATEAQRLAALRDREAVLSPYLVDTWDSFAQAWASTGAISDLSVTLDTGEVYRIYNATARPVQDGLEALDTSRIADTDGRVLVIGDETVGVAGSFQTYAIKSDGRAKRNTPLLHGPLPMTPLDGEAFKLAKAADSNFQAAWSTTSQLDDTEFFSVTVSRRFPSKGSTPGGVVSSQVDLYDLSVRLAERALLSETVGCVLRDEVGEDCATTSASERLTIVVTEGPPESAQLLASSDLTVSFEDEFGRLSRMAASDSPTSLVAITGAALSDGALRQGDAYDRASGEAGIIFQVGLGVDAAFAFSADLETTRACESDPTCGGLIPEDHELSGVGGGLQWKLISVLPEEAFATSTRQWNAVAFLSGAGAILVTTAVVTAFTDAMLHKRDRRMNVDGSATTTTPLRKLVGKMQQLEASAGKKGAALQRAISDRLSREGTKLRFTLVDEVNKVRFAVLCFSDDVTVADVKEAVAVITGAGRPPSLLQEESIEDSIRHTTKSSVQYSAVRSLLDARCLAISLPGSARIQLPPESQEIFWCGEELQEERTIASYAVAEDAQVVLECMSLDVLLGGPPGVPIQRESARKAARMIYRELQRRWELKQAKHRALAASVHPFGGDDEAEALQSSGAIVATDAEKDKPRGGGARGFIASIRIRLMEQYKRASPFLEAPNAAVIGDEAADEWKPLGRTAVYEEARITIHRAVTNSNPLRFWRFLLEEDLQVKARSVHGAGWYGWLYGLTMVAHLCLSFAEAPVAAITDDGRAWVLIADVVLIALHLLDSSLYLVAYSTRFSDVDRDDDFAVDARVGKLRVRALLRVFCIVLMAGDWLVRLGSDYRTGPSGFADFALPYSSLLRPLVVVLRMQVLRVSAKNFVATIVKARRVFLLSVSFLMIFATISVALLRGASSSTELGRGFDDFRSGALTAFIFLASGENYPDVVYDTAEHGSDWFKMYFMAMSFVGLMVIVSLLVASFQRYYSDANRAFHTGRDRAARLYRRAGWIMAYLQLERGLDARIKHRARGAAEAKGADDLDAADAVDVEDAGAGGIRMNGLSEGNFDDFFLQHCKVDPDFYEQYFARTGDDEGEAAAQGSISFQEDLAAMREKLDEVDATVTTSTPELAESVKDFLLRLVRRHAVARGNARKDLVGFVGLCEALAESQPPFYFERPPDADATLDADGARIERYGWGTPGSDATPMPRALGRDVSSFKHHSSTNLAEIQTARLRRGTCTSWVFILSSVLCCCSATRSVSCAVAVARPLDRLADKVYRERRRRFLWRGLRHTWLRGWVAGLTYSYEHPDGRVSGPNVFVPPVLAKLRAIHVHPEPPTMFTYDRLSVFATCVHSFVAMFYGTRVSNQVDVLLTLLMLVAWVDIAFRVVATGWGEFFYGEETRLLVKRGDGLATIKHRNRILANRFDAIVAAVSCVLFVLSRGTGAYAGEESPWRFVTVFPVLKLLSTVHTTRRIVFGLLQLFRAYWSLFAVLALAMYVYAVFGVWLFGGLLTSLDDSVYDMKGANFDSFSLSMGTLFQLLGGEAWNDVLYASIDALDSLRPVFYYVTWILLSSVLFISLVIGIICDQFEEQEQTQDEEREIVSDVNAIRRRKERVANEKEQAQWQRERAAGAGVEAK